MTDPIDILIPERPIPRFRVGIQPQYADGLIKMGTLLQELLQQINKPRFAVGFRLSNLGLFIGFTPPGTLSPDTIELLDRFGANWTLPDQRNLRSALLRHVQTTLQPVLDTFCENTGHDQAVVYFYEKGVLFDIPEANGKRSLATMFAHGADNIKTETRCVIVNRRSFDTFCQIWQIIQSKLAVHTRQDLIVQSDRAPDRLDKPDTATQTPLDDITAMLKASEFALQDLELEGLNLDDIDGLTTASGTLPAPTEDQPDDDNETIDITF